MNCNHIVGIVYEHELTDLITFDEVEEVEKRVKCYIDREVKIFCFCPLCGEKINWE